MNFVWKREYRRGKRDMKAVFNSGETTPEKMWPVMGLFWTGDAYDQGQLRAVRLGIHYNKLKALKKP